MAKNFKDFYNNSHSPKIDIDEEAIRELALAIFIESQHY